MNQKKVGDNERKKKREERIRNERWKKEWEEEKEEEKREEERKKRQKGNKRGEERQGRESVVIIKIISFWNIQSTIDPRGIHSALFS